MIGIAVAMWEKELFCVCAELCGSYRSSHLFLWGQF